MVLLATVDEAKNIAEQTGREMDASVGRLAKDVRVDILRAPPCPFLKDESCTIYEHRPAVCRMYDCDREDQWEKTPDSIRSMVDFTLGLGQTLVADLRNWFPEPIGDVFNRHSRIAFQFSGGKDSLALLLKMQDYWDRMTVYHLDSGDQHPETTALIKRVSDQMVPVEIIQGNVSAVKQAFGLPADVVPWDHTRIAMDANVGKYPLMQDRVSCCYRSIMWPLHQQMINDGVTLIVRGQKNRDAMRGDLQSGDCVEGFEFLFPFSDMSDDDCFNILIEHGVEVPSYYSQGLTHSGDCLGCTAWTTEERRGKYLREFFPQKYETYRRQIREIASAVVQVIPGLLDNYDAC